MDNTVEPIAWVVISVTVTIHVALLFLAYVAIKKKPHWTDFASFDPEAVSAVQVKLRIYAGDRAHVVLYVFRWVRSPGGDLLHLLIFLSFMLFLRLLLSFMLFLSSSSFFILNLLLASDFFFFCLTSFFHFNQLVLLFCAAVNLYIIIMSRSALSFYTNWSFSLLCLNYIASLSPSLPRPQLQ